MMDNEYFSIAYNILMICTKLSEKYIFQIDKRQVYKLFGMWDTFWGTKWGTSSFNLYSQTLDL